MKSYLWASSLTFALFAALQADMFTEKLATYNSLVLLANFIGLTIWGIYLAITVKNDQ